MSSVEVRRTRNTAIKTEVSGFTRNTLTVELVLWMARELQEAVDAGMPTSTEVTVEGSRMRASCVLVEELSLDTDGGDTE